LRYLQEVRARTEPGGFNRPRDIEHGKAFGNDDGMEVDVAASQAIVDVDNIPRLVEQILPGLERTAMVQVVPKDEGILAMDDSVCLQLRGNAAGGEPGAQHHKRLSGRLVGMKTAHANQPTDPNAATRTSHTILRTMELV